MYWKFKKFSNLISCWTTISFLTAKKLYSTNGSRRKTLDYIKLNFKAFQSKNVFNKLIFLNEKLLSQKYKLEVIFCGLADKYIFKYNLL